MALNRRETIKGAVVTAALIACEAVAPAVAAIALPLQACGCPRVHEIVHGHTCVVHDEHGKRWDAYSFEEIAKEHCAVIEVQTDKTDWSCYCGRHGDDDVMLIGTQCVWRKVSYEYNEWECDCVEAFRTEWLNAVTTDWIAMAKADGFT